MRRPRFALVLIGILLPVVILLLALGGRDAPRSPQPAPGDGRPVGTPVCERATAQAHASASGRVAATARFSLPLSVAESATGRRGTAIVRRSETIVEQASASRTVAVSQTIAIRRRACARAVSEQAARGAALRIAYAAALRTARGRAPVLARRRLQALSTQLQPAVQRAAQRLAMSHALAAAASERPKLASQALASAQARVG